MRFTKGNTFGKNSSRRGVPNKVNKEKLVSLVNLCVEDLEERFPTLKNYEKIKILIAFKDIYRDQLTDIQDQAGVIPKVIFIDVKNTETNE